MKKIVKTVLLACLVILPLFALSACSSRSHFATQKDQWQTYTKEKKIKIGFEKSEKINICQFFFLSFIAPYLMTATDFSG